MTISFYKGPTWNPEIGNVPIWVLLNIWRLERVKDTKFGTNVSNEMLLMSGLQLLREHQWGGGKITHFPQSFLINVNKPARNWRLGYIWSDLEMSLMKFFSFFVQENHLSTEPSRFSSSFSRVVPNEFVSTYYQKNTQRLLVYVIIFCIPLRVSTSWTTIPF